MENNNILYIASFVKDDMYEKLKKDIPWGNYGAPRDECFMSLLPTDYTYGSNGFERKYSSKKMIPYVVSLMHYLNVELGRAYDVCFANYYENERQHLGWHADDSPEMDSEHGIGVISFGAERFIYCKHKDYKGEIPEKDKYLLQNGSLFEMPAGYQNEHLHKIPKHSAKCGGRISLTFRKLKKL